MKRYDQIFCIRGSVGRFAKCYWEKGYLPPIEPESMELKLERDWAEVERRYKGYTYHG